MENNKVFEQESKKIKNEIMDLAKRVEESLLLAIDALYNQDIQLAKKAIQDDIAIDKKEIKINNDVILLLTKHQPIATDLRRLVATIKMSSDLERMADHGKNIAESAILLGDDHPFIIPNSLKEMRNIAIEMLHVAMKAYQYDDISITRKLIELDDLVDEHYSVTMKKLLKESSIVNQDNTNNIQYLMQMAFCSRYIERFADHVTNIGEHIIYSVKGEIYNLNQ